MTIPFFLSMITSTLIGTLPLLGPVISGFLPGIMIKKKSPALAVGFLGTIMGGIFCRIMLLYPENSWTQELLYLFGDQIGYLTEMIVQGNPFFFALYFGLLGTLGGLAGAILFRK